MSVQKRQVLLESSPLLEQAFRPSGVARFDGVIPFTPPCLQQVQGAGYDALIQSSSRAMLLALRRDLEESRVSSQTTVSAAALTSEEETAVQTVVAAIDRREPVIAWPPLPRQVRVEFAAESIRVRLRPLSVSVTSGVDPKVTVTCRAELRVLAHETPESHAARVDRESFRDASPPFRNQVPVDSGPVSEEVTVSSTTVRVSGPVHVDADAARFRADARVRFADASLQIEDVQIEDVHLRSAHPDRSGGHRSRLGRTTGCAHGAVLR